MLTGKTENLKEYLIELNLPWKRSSFIGGPGGVEPFKREQ